VLEIFLKTNPSGEKIEYALATKARRHGADAVAARASSARSLPSRARCPDIQCGMPGTIATTRAETTCAFNKTIKINGIRKRARWPARDRRTRRASSILERAALREPGEPAGSARVAPARAKFFGNRFVEHRDDARDRGAPHAITRGRAMSPGSGSSRTFRRDEFDVAIADRHSLPVVSIFDIQCAGFSRIRTREVSRTAM
jgi:hypothetical protein